MTKMLGACGNMSKPPIADFTDSNTTPGIEPVLITVDGSIPGALLL